MARRRRMPPRGRAVPLALAALLGVVALGIVMTGSRGAPRAPGSVEDAGGDARDDGSVGSDAAVDRALAAEDPVDSVSTPVREASPVWRVALSDDVASPVGVGDLIAVVVGAELRLLDPETGFLVRRMSVPAPPASEVRVVGANLVWSDAGGRILAVDSTTGELRWHVELGAVPAAVAADRDRLWLATGREVVCLVASTGALAWRRAVAATAITGLDVASRVGVAVAGRRIVAWNPTSGRERWSVALDAPGRRPVIAGAMVVVADSAGNVGAYRLARGNRRWSRDLGASPAGSPIVHAGGVFVATRDGVVEALDLVTGQRRWRLRTDAGRLLGASDAVLFCLEGTTTLTSVRIDGGNVLSRNGFHDAIEAAPVLWGGYAFVRTRSGLEASKHPRKLG